MEKAITAFIMTCAIVSAAACNKGLTNLEYSNISTFDWLQANVINKNGENMLWFQVFDQIGDDKTIDGYKNARDRVGQYPAKIYENKWIWIMINNRIEIRLIADDRSKEFQNVDKMKEFLQAFDCAGLNRVTGPKLKGADLKKFIPRLGDR